MLLHTRRDFLHALPGLPVAAAVAADPTRPPPAAPQQQQASSDVRAFGAVGDGVTDDAAAIQAAFADAMARRGRVFFPPGGTYLVSRPLLANRVCSVVGYGATIRHPATQMALELRAAVAVEGLTFEGDNAARRDLPVGARCSGATGAEIHHCTFQHERFCVYLLEGTDFSNVSIHHNTFSSFGQGVTSGLRPGTIGDGLTITNNLFFDAHYDAINLNAIGSGSSLAQFIILGNVIRRNTSTALANGLGIGVAGAMDGTSLTVHDGTIAGNVIDGENDGSTRGGQCGIYCEAVKRTLITANVVTRTGNSGPSPERAGIAVVAKGRDQTGNAIVGNLVSLCTGYGIGARNSTDITRQLTISGNVVQGCSRSGIIVADSSNCVITGNMVMGNGAGISIQGPGAAGAFVVGNCSQNNTGDNWYYGGRSAGILELWGAGSPEGVYAAPTGSIFHRVDGGAGTSLYVKETGHGNTGWVGK